MTYGYDDATFTAMSGVTEVQINSGASLTAPDPAHGLLAVIPYLAELGAFTTNQSLFCAFRVQSDDVAVEPKKFVLPNVNTGDAAFTSVAAPALLAYPIDTPLSGGEHINYYGQPLVTNTVEPGIGATVIYSTTGTNGAETKPPPEPQLIQGLSKRMTLV